MNLIIQTKQREVIMRTKMLVFSLVGVVILGIIIFQAVPNAFSIRDEKTEIVKRGEYLVTVGGCHDCHSPKKMTEMGPVVDESLNYSGFQAELKLPKVDMKLIGPGKWDGFIAYGLTAFVGPWGASFAANLTPDNATGIGKWTENTFINTMRNGKHAGAGRQILPPMPWQNIAKATDSDLEAMFAYFKSLPPIKNKVPVPIPPDQLMK
jgi:hypothetical protein